MALESLLSNFQIFTNLMGDCTIPLTAIEWCENYLDSGKTLGVLTRKVKKNKAEQNRAACMRSCMLHKTILASPSALVPSLDHFYNGCEVSFDL